MNQFKKVSQLLFFFQEWNSIQMYIILDPIFNTCIIFTSAKFINDDQWLVGTVLYNVVGLPHLFEEGKKKKKKGKNNNNITILL